jgi:hypothetical protein
VTKPVDLDALLAENAPRVIKLAGQDWTLPGELPPVALEYLTSGRIEDAAAVLVGDDDAAAFAAVLTGPAVRLIFEDVYDLPLEPRASSASSATTGQRRRPTSRRTTASTSARR